MVKTLLPPHEALYPVPVVLVSSSDLSAKKSNIITIAWCGTVCSKPPLISISIRPSRYSHDIISRSGEFVLNIPNENHLTQVDICGTVSGRDIDKFKACSFSCKPSANISAPIIDECPVNIECKTRQVLKLGAHDMFIADILCVHADKSSLTEKGAIDFNKLKPLAFNQGEYWNLGCRLGSYGFSVKQKA